MNAYIVEFKDCHIDGHYTESAVYVVVAPSQEQAEVTIYASKRFDKYAVNVQQIDLSDYSVQYGKEFNSVVACAG